MIFNSMQFLVFYPIVVCLYFVIPLRVRKLWLLLVSYYFYMSWNAKYGLLLLFVTAVTYVLGLCLSNIERGNFVKKQALKKWCLGFGIVVNLMLLFWFKYIGFTITSINTVFSKAGMHVSIPVLDVVLPIGISFFIFQAIGYVIDVYRNDIYAEKNFVIYALFISFFPQLVAGPIERSKNMFKQIGNMPAFDMENVRQGLLSMAYGLFLKVFIADNIANLINPIFIDFEAYRGCELALAAVLFGIQIYCDFGGYTKIAIGSAKVIGFQLMENFESPYLAGNVKEFWRRWHISLTSWFTDYVYIPLGGNRKGKFRKYLNTLLVFSLSGLWHGADWSYVLWGVINGCYLVMHDATEKLRRKLCSVLSVNTEMFGWQVLKRVLVFCLIDFTWIFFRASNISVALKMIKRILLNSDISYIFSTHFLDVFGSGYRFLILCIGIIVLFIVDYAEYKGKDVLKTVLNQQVIIRWMIYFAIIFFIILFGAYGDEYEQTQFIYFQF